MQAIQTTNLSVGYEAKPLLTDVNLKIAVGEFVLLVGGNGSGKSTLLKTLLGLLPPLAGSISLYGKPLSQPAVAHYVSYVPQTTTIERDFPINVEEVISLECRNVDHQHQSSQHHLAEFNAAHLLRRKLSELSGGEFQKVLIARALVSHLALLMLDEPTNNLDAASTNKLLQLLAELNKQGKTIIVITHDPSEYMKLAIKPIIWHLAERKVVRQ